MTASDADPHAPAPSTGTEAAADAFIDARLHGHEEMHKSHRAGWLRAAVLGANDGLLSTASLVIGVAGGTDSRSIVLLSGLAGLFAGAFSMAAGEYSSVSSQRDTEAADLEIERRALSDHPDIELAELAGIYRDRGLPADLAMEVAEKLHQADALRAHARDELGLDPEDLARPIQAAVTSAASFVIGAVIPVLCITLFAIDLRIAVTAVVTLIALGGLGALAARLGGAPPWRAALRLLVLGGLSMAATFLIGNLVGVSV